MSSAAGDLADYLGLNGQGNRTGANINIVDGVMPDEPDLISVLRDTTGLGNTTVMGQKKPILEHPGVQLSFRGADIAAARARAWAAWYLFSEFDGGVINGRRYHVIDVMQPPALLQRDQSERFPEGRPVFVFNVLATRDYTGV